MYQRALLPRGPQRIAAAVLALPEAPAEGGRVQPAEGGRVQPAKKAAPPAAQAEKRKQAEEPPLPESPVPAGVEAEKRRELFARKGDRVEIGFDGEGWLFLGRPDKKSLEGLTFLSKDTGSRGSSFIFLAQEYGDYELGFQLQDNSKGSVQIQTVRLRVVGEEEFSSLLAASSGARGEAGQAKERYGRAERLASLGELQSALGEFLAAYQEGNPYLNDRIAALYAQMGEPLAARTYFERNLDAPAEYADRAVLGLIRAGLALNDPELILPYLDSFLALQSTAIDREILGVARLQKERGRYGPAFALLEEYLKRYPAGASRDEVYFLLGQLFEADSPYRDLLKARDSYRRVYDEFPESLFAADSYGRLRYLERHFFHIQ